jgi:hypothetical protein
MSRSGPRFRRVLVGVMLALTVLTGAGLLAFSRSLDRARAGSLPGTRCVPSELNRSALLPGGLTVSPLPESYDASAHTQISLLGAPARKIENVRVSGSVTGPHGGSLRPYSQGDGASFLASRPFAPGERVRVEGQLATHAGLKPFGFQFTVAYPDPIAPPPTSPKLKLGPGEYQSFHSTPRLHPPDVDVTYSSHPSKGLGDIFAAPYSGPGNDGPMIFEPDGQLVWMDPLPVNVEATNLQVQRYEGRPVLTWWQGGIPINGFGLGEEIVANSSYRPIMHIHAGNGYKADLHSFTIEPGHTAVLTVFATIRCDLSSVGGPREADLTDASFQELDLKTGLVRREWTSADHVALSASYASGKGASAEWPYDYFHLNTIDPEAHDTTLLSARNTSQLYLIDDQTGQITSSIGGKHSSVKVEPEAKTAYQHDATTLADGDIAIFDNGGSPFEHSQSRGLVIKLDAHDGTDTKVAELVHPQALKSESQGSLQQLANGDWFVGWGQEPYFTQFNRSGQMVYDAHMPRYINSYRAYSFKWVGTPATRPAISVEPRGARRVTVYASWNGATKVARWAVLGGASPAQMRRVITRSATGFETPVHVASEPFVQVLALNQTGAVIGRSARIEVPGWAERLHHALKEAGLRCAETWSHLLHWVRGH